MYVPIQPWSYVFGSNTKPYGQQGNAAEPSPLLSYNGPGSFQTINDKMIYLPGAPHSGNMPAEANSRYPMLWYWGQEAQQNALQGQSMTGPYSNGGGHKQYFQQGFYPPVDASGQVISSAKLVNGISKDQISALPVHFHDMRLSTAAGYTMDSVNTARTGTPIPAPIVDYGSGYPQKIEFPTTRIAEHVFDTAVPEPTPPSHLYPHEYHSLQAPHYMVPPTYGEHAHYGTGHALSTMPPRVEEYEFPQSSAVNDEFLRRVPRVEIVEVPQEITRYVPKIETKIVEQVVEVPGPEKIPVPRPYCVDVQVIVPKYEDRNIPLIVSQNIVPEIQEVSETVEVEVVKYEPEISYVDVYVPRPVAIPIKATGEVEQKELPSERVSEEQLQIAMDEINPHLHDVENYNNVQLETFESLVQQSESTARIHGLEAPEPIRRVMYSLEDEQPTQEVAPQENEAVAAIDNVETGTTDFQ
ncbi:alveolin domain containing intermediate filament IMC7 [Cardiosporidium cionae]|uniref:Alveolin domain containing intermediate filament IMC7 n=1 Tax=Cardiosporidium cionae TaxID=476202 RepID=A0ABQ7J620_9APIC|nr:alveolin domain containing intermediate filament IMC7 [Cardiosporidium cionae]|eukprot:KAF8819433.1 alveolin domain containing intermediate filament IMC7 [Cardiosporidium cionae]